MSRAGSRRPGRRRPASPAPPAHTGLVATDPRRSAVFRSARIGALVAGLAARSSLTAVRARFDDDPAALRRWSRTRSANALRSTLGGMKGGALKAGQLLSTVDSLASTSGG